MCNSYPRRSPTTFVKCPPELYHFLTYFYDIIHMSYLMNFLSLKTSSMQIISYHDLLCLIFLVNGMNPFEHARLKRHVDELLWKDFIKESLNPCAITTSLMPKKDGN